MRELLSTSFERVADLEKLARFEDPTWERFRTAFEAYIGAYAATTKYSDLANDRFTISVRPSALFRNSNADSWAQIAGLFQDATSFAPYTEAELDAHTAALGVLTSAFDNLNVACARFERGDPYYATAVGCCEAAGESYAYAADCYSRAVSVASINALEVQLQDARETVAADRVSTHNAFKGKVEAAYKKAEAFETKARGHRGAAERSRFIPSPESLGTPRTLDVV